MFQLGDFNIDVTNSKVYRGENLLVVEPKTFQLLVYFINNPNQIVTRDDLIENLWSGRIVSDNTINKHIANLRRVLGDDPKNVKYLETVSKQGYRLICPVNSLPKKTSPSLNKVSKQLSPMLKTSIVSLFMALLVIYIFLDKNISSSSLTSFEVTREEGVEYSPREIPSKNKILFLNQKLGQSESSLWLKDLQTNQIKTIEIGQYKISHLITATNKSDTIYVYFSADYDNQCNVYKAKLEQFEMLTNITAVFSCQTIQIQDIVLEDVNEVFYYTARKSGQSSFQVYRYDTQEGSHELIKQPAVEAGGNKNIDLSPDKGQLLIMNSNSLNQTTFYVLNLKREKLTRHKTFDYLVTEAIWDYDSKHVLFSTAPPSHQIVRSHIDTNRENDSESIIANVSHYLSNDMSLYQGDQLLFATRQVNFALENLLTFDNKKNIFNNSIVYDTIPALFHQQPYYFFVSNRSGKNQIYLGDLSNGEATNVLNIQQKKVFTNLQVSPNDKYLLIADQSSVWKIPIDKLVNLSAPIDELKAYKVFDSQVQIHNINWLNNEHFVVSTKDTENPHTFFNGNVQLDLVAFKRWLYFFTDHEDLNNVYMVEKSTGRVYISSLSSILNVNLNTQPNIRSLDLNNLIPYDYFDPKIRGDGFFFVTNESRQFYLHHISISKPSLIARYKLQGYFEYDVSKSSLVVSHLRTVQGDIYRTSLK
ncbi:response regulator transcription factor [Colwellia sp. 1_MG-2023]|uniref:winged helix-turn-helix domain-containing protein n=1 Tax=Colwellia sp. 1_MG-2023 TaxID=3062649 RepID=UPI0026E38D6E|nr:response regulator transcription factor [Colwellia sp. 1_MG-2023]MDO6445569.1 response regulator transcription factor [Colwellia sp. 1_MG-2023]